jgi:hypothetical protein
VGDVRASLFMLTWSLIPVRHADRKHGQGRDPLVDECVRHPAIRRTLPLGARGSRVPDVENERAPNWLPPFFLSEQGQLSEMCMPVHRLLISLWLKLKLISSLTNLI